MPSPKLSASPRMTVAASLAALGGGAVGALAGFVVVGMAAMIVTDYLRVSESMEPDSRGWVVGRVIAGGVVLGAVMSAPFGRAEIRGRAAAVIRGAAWGGLIRMPAGPISAAGYGGVVGASYKAVGAS